MTLVLVTNARACKIYNYTQQPNPELQFVELLKHPESSLKTSEIMSDKAGSFKGGGAAIGGTEVPHTERKKIEVQKFTKDIAKKLNHERNQNHLDDVIVIAPPDVDGSLMNNLDKHVKELVTYNIQLDLVNYTDDQLLTFLHKHLRTAN